MIKNYELIYDKEFQKNMELQTVLVKRKYYVLGTTDSLRTRVELHFDSAGQCETTLRGLVHGGFEVKIMETEQIQVMLRTMYDMLRAQSERIDLIYDPTNQNVKNIKTDRVAVGEQPQNSTANNGCDAVPCSPNGETCYA